MELTTTSVMADAGEGLQPIHGRRRARCSTIVGPQSFLTCRRLVRWYDYHFLEFQCICYKTNVLTCSYPTELCMFHQIKLKTKYCSEPFIGHLFERNYTAHLKCHVKVLQNLNDFDKWGPFQTNIFYPTMVLDLDSPSRPDGRSL